MQFSCKPGDDGRQSPVSNVVEIREHDALIRRLLRAVSPE
jgi:hypothetical protein